MMKLQILFCLILISCQNEQKQCAYNLKGLLAEKEFKLIQTTSKNDTVIQVDNIGIDSCRGVYSFYPNGKLKSYVFYANKTGYTFNEIYDEHEKLLKIEGNPMVYSTIELKTMDSIAVTLYFSSIFKKYKKIYLSINTGEKFNVDFNDDSIFTDMKVASLLFDRKKLNQIAIHVSADYLLFCDGSMNNIKDTISFYYHSPQ